MKKILIFIVIIEFFVILFLNNEYKESRNYFTRSRIIKVDKNKKYVETEDGTFYLKPDIKIDVTPGAFYVFIVHKEGLLQRPYIVDGIHINPAGSPKYQD